MLRNFITVAFRNLIRQKFYSLINITGLAVGLACCILILLFVQDELSYDQHHSKGDRIHRAVADIKFGEMDGKMAQLPAPLAPTLMTDFPEVESAARLRTRGSYLVKRQGEETNIKEERLVFSDPELFQIFDYQTIQGDPIENFRAPKTLVITQSKAEKYFPDEDPIGKVLVLDNRTEYTVVAVVADNEKNAHFTYDFFMSMETLDEAKQGIWLSHNFYTYILLKEGAEPTYLEEKFPDLLKKYAGPQVLQFLGTSWEEMEGSGELSIGYSLQPLKDIHLRSGEIDGLGGRGDITYVYIFSAIALFILLIACINFMNLATARSAKRAREVGVRKVLGSYRGQLMGQFMIESMLMSLIATLLAVGISALFLPMMNELTGKSLALPFSAPLFPMILLGVAILIGGLAGLYPAFFLSSFKPVEVLKSRFTAKGGGSALRSGLVVFQFWCSIILIVSTIVVNQQMNYVQNKKLGFNKDQVLILEDTYVLRKQVQTFKQEMLAHPAITHATVTGYLPVSSNRNNNLFWPKGTLTQDNGVIMENWVVDHDYIQTMGMEIIDGRDFSIDFPTDSQGVILNETAIAHFGFEEDPVGQSISTYSDIDAETGEKTYTHFKVVGVVKDFHFSSFKENIMALGLVVGRSSSSICFRTNMDDLEGTLADLKEKWNEFLPGQPFDYSFLDARFDRMFRAEQRLGKLLASFAFLAILVACLGLFALASFMAEQRAKEIGIRKVLGASVSNIMVLLSQNFLKLVLIALIFAVPVAWYAMNQWLEDFAYRTEINGWTFALAAVLAVAISLMTISYQSLKAALANPIDSLKDE